MAQRSWSYLWQQLFTEALSVTLQAGGGRMSSNTQIEYQFAIENGPSAERIVDSFKYAFSSTKLSVMFEGILSGMGLVPIKDSKLEVIVTSICYESGAEGAFLIEGYAPKIPGVRISGYYDAKRRIGSLLRRAN
ncbi:MAG: hypothetical protein ACSLEY_00490 [Candidatus Saccharimonadales bacterium]